MAGENVPFRCDVRHARRLLPEIGEPRLLLGYALHNATPRHDLGLGILLDFSVHHIRAVRELFGEPDRVFASRAENTVGGRDTRDNVTIILSSAAGWQAVLSLSWQGAAGSFPEFIATGSRGAIKIWPDGRFVDLYSGSPNRLGRLISRLRPYRLQRFFQSPELQRRRHTISNSDRMGYSAELRAFWGAIEAGARDLGSAYQARRDVEIALAAEASLAAGATVDCSVDHHQQACADHSSRNSRAM
jgi:predicted dehydrogenase